MYSDTLNNAKDIQNLLKKKEFAQLYVDSKKSFKHEEFLNTLSLNEEIFRENLLILHSHQLFVRNLINPDTPYTRLLLKHSTGSGKTLAAISVAMLFIKYYQLDYNMVQESNFIQTPLVYVIGFSKNIFQRELLRRPEFGFINRDEIIELSRLRYLAETGSQHDREVFTEFEAKLKKRLSRKTRGGFFKFYGYKEFFNRLFLFPETVQLKEEEENEGETVVSGFNEEQILAGLKSGQITLNLELIDSFKNSLIICDEIHNVYNSSEINNYGIALKMLLNIYDSPDLINKELKIEGKTTQGVDRIHMLKNSNLRILLMSATPINNSPTEIIDLLNLLIPLSKQQSKNIRGLIKEDFFEDSRNLKPGALDRIQDMVYGYVSFLRDDNPKYFPEKIIDGVEIKIPDKYLSERVHFYKQTVIPYLKFILCPMSPLHQETYDNLMKESDTLPPDGQSLIDMVLPNPGLLKTHSQKYGLFKTKDIKYNLFNAPKDWLDKHQISLEKIPNTNNYYITGEFMKHDNLVKYSAKYAKMLEYIFDNLAKDKGKIVISHQYVKMSGVLFIQEVLRRNGILDEYTGASDDTLCSICGIKRSKHNDKTGHTFIPARFIIYHGDIDRAILDKSIEKFKSGANINGYYFRILIGSKIINEGLDLNAVQNLWIMTVPANFPTLLQIFGRAIRKNSHVGLPSEKNKVKIKIFISVGNDKHELSYEARKYFEKSQDYLIIQQLEKVFNENAIDAVILRNIIMPPEQKQAYKQKDGELGDLYFEPSKIFGEEWLSIHDSKEIKLKDLDLTTFRMYHSNEEISLIIYIIKRLFIEQSTVWKYEDLWEMVQDPPFQLQVNPQLFLEENFIIALNTITETQNPQTVDSYQITSIDSNDSRIMRLFDSSDKMIVLPNGKECKIFFIPMDKSGYYILFPIITDYVHERDENKSNYLGISSLNLIGIPDIDIDNWYRQSENIENSHFQVTKYLKTSNISYNYMKFKFYSQYHDTPIEEMPTATEVYDLDFHTHLIEDSIRYAFNILTNIETPFSEIHEFYFKMLYFYDRLEMILFANALQDTKLISHYKDYISPVDIDNDMIEDRKDAKKKQIILNYEKYNPFLMSSIIKSTGNQSFDIHRLNDFLHKIGHPHYSNVKKAPRLDQIDIAKQLKKPKTIKRIPSNMLPVGHFLSSSMEASTIVSVPKIYIPSLDSDLNHSSQKTNPWIKAYEFNQPTDDQVDNDIIVGYYEKNPSGIDVKFKLRQPSQKIKIYDDSRLIERGSACTTRKKEELVEIARQLDITNINDSDSIKVICNEIKLELMYREMKERRLFKHMSPEDRKKNKRIRWFYFHFERLS